MTAADRDLGAACHIWKHTSGADINFQKVKAHIGSCPDCAGSSPADTWFLIQGFVRSIDRGHVHGARR